MKANLTIDAGFWDRLAPKYAKKPVPNEDAYRQTLERTRAYLAPHARVLEFGCGTGTTALKLAPHVAEIVATDLSGEMISIARGKARDQGINNVKFEAGTVEDPKLLPGTFDVVMAFNLLHLLGDVPASLQRVHDLLKPGGLFITKTPCVAENRVLIWFVIPLMRAFGKAPFVNDLTRTTLQASISSAGFEVVEHDHIPQKSQSLFVVARRPLG